MSHTTWIQINCDFFSMDEGRCVVNKRCESYKYSVARQQARGVGWTQTLEGYDRCPKHKDR